jgi:hypothetical protein
MIKFACHCNHVFEFPEDMGGKSVQCPNCQRLVDVPTLNEIAELSEDGTFRMDTAVEREPGHFEKMRQVYGRDKVDENGLEVDRRQTRQEMAAAGTEDDIFEFEHNPTAPKYDPETGELIRPIEFVDDPTIAPHPSQVPLATNTLSYATPEHQGDVPYSPLLRLLSPVNLVTMFFVLLCHVFFFCTAIVPLLSVLAIVLVGPAIIAHYANVIEEVGIEERDELPRFLRLFNFFDDIWIPCAHVFLAWIICFAPAEVLSMVWSHYRLSLAGGVCVRLIFDVAGLIFFPAVVLTTTTSGSFANLHPRRVLSVISAIGPRYAFLVMLHAVAFVFYLVGVVIPPLQLVLFITNSRIHFPDYAAPGACGLLVVAIFLMHYFSWLLGLEYRRLNQKFHWVFHQQTRIIPGVNAARYSRPVRGFPVQPPRQG